MSENEEDFQKFETSRIEPSATSLLKQNESSQTIVNQNESILNGWPNLSQVKRDQHGLMLIDGDYLEDRLTRIKSRTLIRKPRPSPTKSSSIV